ncbi:histidine kinase [Kribbella sp. VKM Ac-2527]|uniref:histidine kinase n=1 Tax=Kribbella caucasensis TaxID=2512215 RepID=A0A4R6KPR0_9ACTN|nr:histidine kinase [Kribbella sp. VKM Ac-2527]TDO52685.1 histidine kinase [Kribbella sp. VKM Ac-2527]
MRLWGRRRTIREQLAALLVLGGLVVFVVLVYVLVVLGGGALIDHTSSPHVGLSVLATAVVALGFEPVRSRFEVFTTRLLHGGVQSPYEVLSLFSSALTGSRENDDLPARMAEVLAEGTGAKAAQVWLMVDDQLRLAATWPPAADSSSGADDMPGRRELPVRQAGELLGVLAVQERENVPLTPVEERLFAGLANQAGLVLRGVRLRAELVHRLAELSTLAEELQLSRQRLVDVQDAERRRLERDIHDGAQQHLVALAVNLRLAHTLAQRSPDRADRLIAEQREAATATIETIISLSRGIYPSLLVDEGLTAALRTAIARNPLPVELVAADLGRYPAGVEAAAYFCALEALQNSAKHSAAKAIRMDLRGGPGVLEVIVQDDGSGFDLGATHAGAGLANMRDRIESAGGRLTIRTAPSGGTLVAARLPGVRRPSRPEG